jgi:cell division protein FtsX
MARLKARKRASLPDRAFAYVDSRGRRRLPINDAAHVRNAIARFDQVEGVTDEERDEAWQRIQKAAKKYGVHMGEDDWRELFTRHPDEPKR